MRARAALLAQTVAIVIVGAVGAPSTAGAAPDEVVLAIEPGYERLSREIASDNGVGGTATAWIGLTDSLWLTVSGGAFQTVGTPPERDDLTRWEAFGGITAALDVFRIVPSLELLVGTVGARGKVFPTIRFGAAFDYLFTPEWSAGVAIRMRPLPEEDIAQAATTAQARIAYRFAW